MAVNVKCEYIKIDGELHILHYYIKSTQILISQKNGSRLVATRRFLKITFPCRETHQT